VFGGFPIFFARLHLLSSDPVSFSDSSHLCFSICPYCRKFDFELPSMMVLIGNCQGAAIFEYKLRMPASTLWFSSTTDVIFQVLHAFWTHFAFFGVLVLSQVSSIYWNMSTSKFDQGFYFHHGFGMSWLGIFTGMRSSNVDLECRHWFCDLDGRMDAFLGHILETLWVLLNLLYLLNECVQCFCISDTYL